jgi:tripartite-type tricarboxylate transporter receptor subunit TctC
MKLPRRKFLHLAAGAGALPAASRIARAQTYPSRPVKIIVPFAPAGSTDIVARLMGQWLSERLGQQFVVENRPGAGTNIGTEAVVTAPADGYTLLLAGPANVISMTLYDKLNFNFTRDIAPIASIMRFPFVMEVHPSVPAKTVPEFMAYAKANPGKLNMASAGTGSATHLTGELFKMMTDLNILHVPYRGAGPALPDIPTVGDFVPGYESSGWHGVAAPKNTPTEIIDKLNKEINVALTEPRIKARIADLGGTVFAGSPSDFSKLIVEETEKWAKVIKFSGAKPEG